MILASNASSQDIGYILTIKDSKSPKTNFFKTQSIEKVQDSILLYTGLEMNLQNLFEGNDLFFEYRNNDFGIYCERKIIKHKKNGNMVYRKITQNTLDEIRLNENKICDTIEFITEIKKYVTK